MCTMTICSVLCVYMAEGMSVVVNVMLSLMSVMSPLPALCNLSVRTVVQLSTFCVKSACVSLNKQFDFLELVFDSVYVDLLYDEISFTFTAGYVCLCGGCSHVVVFGLSVRLSW